MKKLILLTLLVVAFNSMAQIVPQTNVTGNNASSIDWKYVDTKAIKVIFPAGNEKEATRIANIINYISDSAAGTVGDKRKKLDMLLQTGQVVSNGYVALAPYRSELYATGIQNINVVGSAAFLDLLAFHEYRHALQFANSRRGFTKFMYLIGGETMWTLAQLASVPDWYLEGDAVQTETMFTGAGRGRTPFFFQEQRALLLNDVHYRYAKARNGSLKSMMPDHYRLGYAIMHQVRNDKGPDVWAKILKDGASYKGIIYPFSHAMKRHTGFNSSKTYYRTYDTLKTTWENELKTMNLIPTQRITDESKRVVTNYEWPNYLSDGRLVAFRNTFNRTQDLVVIKDGKAEHITDIGNMVTESFLSVNNNVAAWTELTNDARYINNNYSEVITYNFDTEKRKRVTVKSKLFSPMYSAKKNQIVAVKSDAALKNAIVFINPETGAEMESIPNPENDFIAYPRWTRDDAAIVYTIKRGPLVGLMKYDLASKQVTELTPLSMQIIEGTSAGKDKVYFSASYSGINNIYSVSLSGDKVIKQLTSVKIGAINPVISADEQTVTFVELGVMGYGLYSQKVDMANAPTMTVVEPYEQTRYKVLTTSIESQLYPRIPTNTFEVKNYAGPIRSPKLHSWTFLPTQSEVALTVKINNVLNDFGAEVSVGRNLNEDVNFIKGTVDFAKYFVPVNLSLSINGREISEPTNFSDTGKYSQNSFAFNETIYGGGLALPLSWNHNIYTTTLRVIGNVGMINTSKYTLNDTTDLNKSVNVGVLEGGVTLTNYHARAKQNFNPRFGQDLKIIVSSSVSNASALRVQASGGLFFPGLLRNHSIRLSAGYKQEDLTNDYRFLDNFDHARGYTPMQGDEEIVYSANYALPIGYPDFGIAGIIYFKRLRANVYADFSTVKREALNKTFDQNSYGVEVLFDVVMINSTKITAGLRQSTLSNNDYFNEDKNSNFGFFFAGIF